MSKRRSREEWGELLKRYSKRTVPREVFCAEEGVSPASLQYQLDRQRTESSFLPAVRKEVVCPRIELELPSGVCLRIFG
jgi:hypothetical protein